MKDKSGFTLIELLVTIFLMTIISVIVGVSVSSVLNRQKEEDLRYYIETVEKTVFTYAGIKYTDGFPRIVTFFELTDGGYLRKDIKNPSTGKLTIASGSEKIKVELKNSELICTYMGSGS